MSVVKGKSFLLMVQKSGVYVPIATGRDISLDQQREVLEASSSSSGKWREFIKGKITANISVSGLQSYNYSSFFTADNIFDEFSGNDSGSLPFQFVANGDGGSVLYSGNILLTSLSLKRSYNDASVFDLSAQVTGPVTRTTSGTPITPPTTGVLIVNPTSVIAIEYTATGGESVTNPLLVGIIPLIVTRGGIETGTIITSGTPTGSQVLYNSSTGTFVFSSDNPLVAGEFVRFIYSKTINVYQFISSTSGATYINTSLEDKTMISFSRNGIAQSIITSGTPSGAQIKFDNTTGTITFPSGNLLTVGESIRIVYE